MAGKVKEKKTKMFLALAATILLFGSCSAALVQWSVDSGGNGHWYEAVHVPASIMWSAASDAAGSAGGYLATLTSEPENQFVYNLVSDDKFWLLAARTNAGPWIGGYQDGNAEGYSEPGGGWRWVTNEPFAYTNWAPLQPDNGNAGEDRLHFFGWEDNKTPQWNDAPDIEHILGYVIEYEQAPVPEPSSLLALGAGVLGLAGFIRKKHGSWLMVNGGGDHQISSSVCF